MRGQVGDRDLRDGTAVGQNGVVVDHQGTVGAAADVELDTVGAQAARLEERLERVLEVAHGATPVGEDRRHGARPSVAGDLVLGLVGRLVVGRPMWGASQTRNGPGTPRGPSSDDHVVGQRALRGW